MLNPFDPQAALLAKHAQHVVLIHFPIALFITGVAFDFVAQWTGRRSWADASYYNLLLAAASTVPVLITGILAWQLALEGQKLKGILLQHLVFALDGLPVPFSRRRQRVFNYQLLLNWCGCFGGAHRTPWRLPER
jgi:hypothetical protein